MLYLGEINDSQREAWCRVIEAFDEGIGRQRQLALFPADRTIPAHARGHGVQVRLDAMELRRPRQWGACWLACQLYEQLGLDRFWAQRLPDSREGTCWQHILQTLVCYRLIDPGSEWRLHRLWFEHSAMADLLGADDALVEKNALYRCLDKLQEHKTALFSHLRQRWQDLFGARFEVLLYDLTSTYFESPPPEDEEDKRRHGYSRDKRGDCVQVVIALIVTPEGFPLAYEVLPGNTADCTTLRAFLRRIEVQYGKAERIWVMDRGIPTEEVLAEMRQADPPICYL
ncbi:MAG: IS1634 family transposase, partial [Xanthobacteraceae bacterium]|nr:IS1634 family transposase [Xanthobacteraceae bacterium]